MYILLILLNVQPHHGRHAETSESVEVLVWCQIHQANVLMKFRLVFRTYKRTHSIYKQSTENTFYVSKAKSIKPMSS